MPHLQDQPFQAEPTPQIPVTFWPQLLARLTEKNPKFFNVLAKNSVYFSLITAGLPFVIKTLLPLLEIPVPSWLSYTNRVVLGLVTLLSGAGLGAVFAANTTLTTAAPPLVTGDNKPTVESLQKELDALRTQVGGSNANQTLP